ncbi:hypothetical protein KR054_010959 [Drosophila jambulina]|nr:hypothetical protein KR054_010959 [Drosophila jambulina]
MLLNNFLCCIPLVWGVAITGIVCGTLDFVMGSMGWKMVIQDKYADWLIEFFREMSTRTCVSTCAVLFYVLAFIHFLLAYGAYTHNHLIVGTWLLVNYTVFLFTLVTGLLSGLAILRIRK